MDGLGDPRLALGERLLCRSTREPRRREAPEPRREEATDRRRGVHWPDLGVDAPETCRCLDCARSCSPIWAKNLMTASWLSSAERKPGVHGSNMEASLFSFAVRRFCAWVAPAQDLRGAVDALWRACGRSLDGEWQSSHLADVLEWACGVGDGDGVVRVTAPPKPRQAGARFLVSPLLLLINSRATCSSKTSILAVSKRSLRELSKGGSRSLPGAAMFATRGHTGPTWSSSGSQEGDSSTTASKARTAESSRAMCQR
mmetsp:Transcript_8494/g.23886  ORF Transcript_8494/g.23886 Transcript_8494/m.23886 type:complete len:257 (+) Transcript_8494:2337-3107(+)